MISFIEFADYVVRPGDSLCENGMIDNLPECKEAAHQLNFDFAEEEETTNYPGGCYVVYDIPTDSVYFNKNFTGASKNIAHPICRKGK